MAGSTAIEPEDIDEQEGAVTSAPKLVKKRRKKEETARFQELEDMRALLKTYGGRAFCWRVLSRCGIYEENLCADVLPMAKREGKRAIGIWLLTELLTAEPSIYTQMQVEAVSRDTDAGRASVG